MFFTYRGFRTVGLAASSLTLITALGVAITDAPPPGMSTAIGKPAPRSVRPDSVAINPSAVGGTDPRRHLKVPGNIADARSVRGPRARLLGDTAGAVRVGPQGTLAGRSADGGTVAEPQGTRSGSTADGGTAEGGTVPGPQATRPGTALGAQATVLGLDIGAQVTLR